MLILLTAILLILHKSWGIKENPKKVTHTTNTNPVTRARGTEREGKKHTHIRHPSHKKQSRPLKRVDACAWRL
jgi:hypothetical protein